MCVCVGGGGGGGGGEAWTCHRVHRNADLVPFWHTYIVLRQHFCAAKCYLATIPLDKRARARICNEASDLPPLIGLVTHIR